MFHLCVPSHVPGSADEYHTRHPFVICQPYTVAAKLSKCSRKLVHLILE